MKLLPIVKGCRAICTACNHPDYMSCIGKEFAIGDQVGGVSPCSRCSRQYRWEAIGHGLHLGICECALMRIDGGDFRVEEEKEREAPLSRIDAIKREMLREGVKIMVRPR